MYSKINALGVKKIILWVLLVLILSSCGTTEETKNNTVSDNNVENRIEEILASQPDYKSDLYWKVRSIEWNIFTITEIDRTKDPTADMTPAEKRKYMQALPESERMALKEQIQSATLWDLKVMIPVWIPMIKKELVWEDRLDVEASLVDLKSNDIVNIWYNKEETNRKIAIFVKRSIRK